MGVTLAAGAWGFAEATLFFIVPDVLLTWLALDRPRLAWRACLWAVAGAVAGGVLMYAWAARQPAAAGATLDRIPAIDPEMREGVREKLRSHGSAALFLGPIGGVPYKIYAVEAGALGINLPAFALLSAPARVIRFLLVIGVTLVACKLWSGVKLPARRLIHVGIWVAFYSWYFWSFSD